MSNDDWCTIESDPGVFTSLIESFGTKNVEFTELWSLDDDSLQQLTSPMEGVEDASVHGLIFLFKWQSSSRGGGGGGDETITTAATGTDNDDDRSMPLTGEEAPPGVFFARQTIHNACATQAILSVLFNAPNSIIESSEEKGSGEDATASKVGGTTDDKNGRRLILGKTLSDFRSFTSTFPPDMRGEVIGSSEVIRSAHNSFGRDMSSFLDDPTKSKRSATDDDDVFHFVAFVPHEVDGCVYELDGLQPGPIRVGSYINNTNGGNDNTMSWLRVARDAIQNRLSAYPSTEIKFNLLAMVQDRRTYLCERLDNLVAIGMEEIDPAMLHVRSELHAEEEKRDRWKVENERRRHNYLPFVIEYLRCLAGTGKFDQLIELAMKNHTEKKERSEAWKKSLKSEE